MKENVLRFFNGNILRNKIMVKLWDDKKQKWYFEVINVKKEEANAIISYDELLNRSKHKK